MELHELLAICWVLNIGHAEVPVLRIGKGGVVLGVGSMACV